jgi:hypothetical protein
MNCSRRIGDSYAKCPYCGAYVEEEVHVMSKEESRAYNGITIENEPDLKNESNNGKIGYDGGFKFGGNVFSKKISFGLWSGKGWLFKIAVWLCILAIASILLFVFLPMAVLALAVGIAVWFILELFR